MILNKDEIVNYEKKYFNKVKSCFHDLYPDYSFLFILESWNVDEKGIRYIKDNHMNLNHYETWISVYPLFHSSYLMMNDCVLTACSCLLTVKCHEMSINDSCIHQLSKQMEEIIDDIDYCHTQHVLINNHDEFCMYAKMLSQ